MFFVFKLYICVSSFNLYLVKEASRWMTGGFLFLYPASNGKMMPEIGNECNHHGLLVGQGDGPGLRRLFMKRIDSRGLENIGHKKKVN